MHQETRLQKTSSSKTKNQNILAEDFNMVDLLLYRKGGNP